MKKRILASLLALAVLVGVLPLSAMAADGDTFSDVSASDWYYTEVEWAAENGLMDGTGDAIFSPKALTNRGMLVTTLYRMEGKPEVSPTTTFTDVSGSEWYVPAVMWAAENKIVEGYPDGSFRPLEVLTREQIAVIVNRYVAYKEQDVSAKAELTVFEDVAAISDYAKEAMEWAVAAELINGVTETKLAPLDNATRAQLAVILYRIKTDLVPDVIDDNDTPLAEGPTGGSSSGGGGGVSRTTVTLSLGGGAFAATPDGWTANDDGTYSIRVNTGAVSGLADTLPVPTREGYTFRGWILSENNITAEWNVVYKTVTLSGVPADWNAPEGWSYNAETRLWSAQVPSVGGSVDPDTLTGIEREGYTLSWNEDDPDNIVAVWTPITRTVTLTLDNGVVWTAPEGWSNIETGIWTRELFVLDGVESLKETLGTPVWEGHGFVDWNINEETNTITASWIDITIPVTIDLAGGAISDESWVYDETNAVYTKNFAYGTEVGEVLLPEATREGFVFAGWEENGINGFIAKWAVTVTLDLADGIVADATGWEEGANGTYTKQVAEADIENIDPESFPEVTRAGFTFKVWEKAEDSYTYTAVWEEQLVLVTILLDGGVLADTVIGWEAVEGGYCRNYSFSEQPVTIDSLPNDVVKTGYVFVEWVKTEGSETYTATWRKTAELVTNEAVEAVQAELEKIVGNENAQLVTLEAVDNGYALTLNADAVMANDAAVNDDMLNGLMTKIKTALDAQFNGFSIAVDGNVVYADKKFNNTELKNALFSVADGFFYTLANMQPVDGVYTYKTVSGAVSNTDPAVDDTYNFSVAVQLKGEDVAKVQALAKALSDHLAMDNVSAAEAESLYGYTAGGENNYIVVTVDMPESFVKAVDMYVEETAKKAAADNPGIDAKKYAAELRKNIRSILDNGTVGGALNILSSMDAVSMLPENYQNDANSLISTVNNNANAVNKVLRKLDVKVSVKGEDGNYTTESFITGSFAPAADKTSVWENFMAGVNKMVEGSAVLSSKIGSYAITESTGIYADGSYYLVPVTVAVDLASSMDFKATETVLVVLHIPFGTEPEPVRNAETVTNAAVDAVKAELEKITGNGKQLIELAADGNKYALTLNADAIMANGAAFDSDMLNGLMTKIKTALDAQFEGYSVAVEGNTVYADKAFDGSALKKALFSVADGLFYTLANMQPVDGVYTYKTVEGTVANLTEATDTYTFDVNVQLKGEDVAKVKTLAKALSDHLAMEKLEKADVNTRYGYENLDDGENEYIVVTVEMPETLINKVQEVISKNDMDEAQVREILNGFTVENAMGIMAQTDITSMLPEAYINDANSLISTVNSNAAAVNKVLSKLTVYVKDSKFVTGTFVPGTDAAKTPWQNFMVGVNGMIKDSAVLDTTIGSYSVTQGESKFTDGSYYIVPVAVAVDLESSMEFKATETVLVVLHIPFGTGSGTVTPEPEKTAWTVTNEAVEAIQAELGEIKGHDGAQLVTLESAPGGYALTLNADAIMADNAAVDSGMLDGLMTKIKTALDAQFEGYAIKVADNVVYDGEFNNTALKNTLFSVADGFFYMLANMEKVTDEESGEVSYVYKRIKEIVVENKTDAEDTNGFEIAIQLKGDDVAKVQALATKLSENLAMQKLDADTVATLYGYAGSESEYVVVSVEMPDTLMAEVNKKLEGMNKEQLENIREVLNGLDVNTAISAVANANITSLIPEQSVNDVNSVLSLVNNNAAAVNKVLSKLNVTIDGKEFVTGEFAPATDKDGEWQNFMAGIQAAIEGSEVLGTKIGDYVVKSGEYAADGSYYVVPVTVGIDLESSMDFTATETVLIVLHIELGA